MSRPVTAQVDLLTEKILDSFAGGGGTSTGIELATGRIVDFAINHDPAAILMHKTNHPHTIRRRFPYFVGSTISAPTLALCLSGGKPKEGIYS